MQVKMQITDIEEIGKNKFKVYLDEEFAFVLYKGELYRYQIQKGEEIQEPVYQEIMEILLPKRAKLRAMNLLKCREYTEAGLRTKLHLGYYPEGIIEEAISYVKSYGYINDARYARDYVEYHAYNRNRCQLVNKLLGKGIERQIVEQTLDDFYFRNGGDLEIEQIINRFQKKYKGDSPTNKEDEMHFINSLLGKGYRMESIKKALKAISLSEIYN